MVQEIKIIVPTEAFQPHEWQLKILQKFDSQAKRFFLLCWHRRARKTTLLLNLLIRECVKNSKGVYGYIAPTYKQAKAIVWRDPNMLDRYLPMALVAKKNETELFIEFLNKSVLVIKGADEPESLKGLDFAGVAIDEWALMKPEIWEEVIRPVIAQDINRWAMFAFTPKGRNHAYKYLLMAKDNPEWEYDLLPASVSHLYPPEELEKLRKEMPERLYQQEIECEFLEDVASVFRGIDACVTGRLEEPKAGFSYVIGGDLARTEDFTVLVCICRETRQVVAFDRFQEVSWHLQKERISQMSYKYNNAEVLIDSTGVGDPIEEDLRRAGISVDGFRFTQISKQELIERLIIAIEQRLITFPKIEQLINELKAFEYKITPGGNLTYGAPEGYYDDCVIALALAVRAMRSFLYNRDTSKNRPKQNLITAGAY